MSAETVAEAFARTADAHRDRVALVYLGERYTYGALADAAARVAGALREMGVAPTDRAIVYLPNVPQWLIAWLALQRIGAVAVPITPHYGLADLEHIARDSGAETIFCLDTNFGYVSRLLGPSPLRRAVVTTLAEPLPLWKRAVGRALRRIPEGRVRSGAGVIPFRRLLRGPAAAVPVPAGGADVAEILYTGGTTGRPKGVPLSHALLLASVRAQRSASEPLIPLGEDVVIQGSPLYHILGQAVGLGALLHGERIVLMPRINLDATLDHVRRYRATTLFGVPALFRMILEHDRVDQYDLGSLRYCFSGGDVLPVEVERRWRARFGKPIHQGYGATEACGAIALTPTGAPFPEGTAGRVVAFQELRLADLATLEPVVVGEPGEALVSSTHMVRAYWNSADETARSFVELEGRRWYRTGDILRRDDAGWLFFVDRSADVIKHKGYRVAASRIEAALQEHPAVIESCAVGIPDPVVGERIKAFVVLTQDARGVTAHDLLAWTRDRLAPHEVPHYIEFRDMLPKSKVGKLLRRELRDEERQLAGAS